MGARMRTRYRHAKLRGRTAKSMAGAGMRSELEIRGLR